MGDKKPFPGGTPYEPLDPLKMVMHQNERFKTIGNITWEILRVPGGWLYVNLHTNQSHYVTIGRMI